VALTPALVAASDWLFFGAPMSPTKASGIIVAMFGCLLVVSNGDPCSCSSAGRSASANG
jgi:drug/metabolite transporter (DMT)-like permease